jgi:hypothetical protein
MRWWRGVKINTLYDISIVKGKYPLGLYTYPCVNPNDDFLKDKNVMLFENKMTILGENIIRLCKGKGANIYNTARENTDILIVNAPFLKNDKLCQTEEMYFEILFHYIKPAQKIIPYMLKKGIGQIVFILPPNSTVPSIEYAQMAAFATVGLTKGLAVQYAPKGIVVNGIVLGDKEDYDTIAEWVVFLSSGNARNIVGELIVLD